METSTKVHRIERETSMKVLKMGRLSSLGRHPHPTLETKQRTKASEPHGSVVHDTEV